MIIYKATNKINGKCYIGQTVQKFEERIKRHLNGGKAYFSNAVRKNGLEGFDWKIIERCDSKDELDEMEFHYIKQYNTFTPDGYNLTLGGGKGTFGYKHSEKTKEKMRKPKTAEHKKRLSDAAKNRKISEETRKILSKCNSGKGNGMYGKKHSKETKKKISDKSNNSGENNPMYGKYGEDNSNYNKIRKLWKIIYPDGREVITGLSKFGRDYEIETGIKLHVSNFHHVAKGSIKTYKGFRCERM